MSLCLMLEVLCLTGGETADIDALPGRAAIGGTAEALEAVGVARPEAKP
jgi:hypothetical protein